ncbi:MAG: hypothetical protein KIT31_39580 [Deltaproteobacteria bacterium]|nr:hypothetical protein [Deltaproteobacteria bacterium]
MGRTGLYHDPLPFRPARAEVQLEHDVLQLRMPDGKQRSYALDGCAPTIADGFVVARVDRGHERRFVRMLILERGEHERSVVITPPDHGAVAPNVVRVPEAPADAAIIDARAWEPLADWLTTGGRLAAWSFPELARLAAIASAQFAALIGEIAAERALELAWSSRGPLRGGIDLEASLQPFVDLARTEPRVADALVAALAHAAGSARGRSSAANDDVAIRPRHRR